MKVRWHGACDSLNTKKVGLNTKKVGLNTKKVGRYYEKSGASLYLLRKKWGKFKNS